MSMIKRLLTLLVLLLFFAAIYRVMVVGAQAQPANGGCPEGSYNIGISKTDEPLCKLNPTGCPYGDSIPLGADCDKHAPEPVSQGVVAAPEPEPYQDMGGK